jgi:RNAse (barnase) inhibitor barstar
METVELLDKILNGTAVALPLTVTGVVILWKHLEKKDEKLNALSNSVVNLLAENHKQMSEVSTINHELKMSIRENTKVTRDLYNSHRTLTKKINQVIRQTHEHIANS